jgi:hypothetical protein
MASTRVLVHITLSLRCGEQKTHNLAREYWEIIADNLKKAGWSLGYVSAIDSQGRTIWIVDAHRGDGKRFVVHAEEKLTAFLELESAIREFDADCAIAGKHVRSIPVGRHRRAQS